MMPGRGVAATMSGYRELVFERQKKLGILPDHAELTPINPYIDEKSADGKGWSELDTVRPWDSLSDDEQRLFARMAEVSAGFLSHADNEIGRLLDYLEHSGQLENTMIVLVSDNGASGEGGPNGSVNENKIFNGLPDKIEEALPYLDELGTPRTYNHYPTGWACAFNTQLYRDEHAHRERQASCPPTTDDHTLSRRGSVRRIKPRAVDRKVVAALDDNRRRPAGRQLREVVVLDQQLAARTQDPASLAQDTPVVAVGSNQTT
jgi:arylsulfatase A-like enzyme